ncbi:MAG: hypothetical protein V3S68_09815 [Dehalococcoidia bacterium]
MPLTVTLTIDYVRTASISSKIHVAEVTGKTTFCGYIVVGKSVMPGRQSDICYNCLRVAVNTLGLNNLFSTMLLG